MDYQDYHYYHNDPNLLDLDDKMDNNIDYNSNQTNSSQYFSNFEPEYSQEFQNYTDEQYSDYGGDYSTSNYTIQPDERLDYGEVSDSRPIKTPPPPKEPLNSNKICVICGTDSIGKRYGVRLCRSCEEFFRQYRDRSLKCEKRNACVINARTRNQCKFCRLQKCISVGMKSVYDRTKQRGNVSRQHPASQAPPFQELGVPEVNLQYNYDHGYNNVMEMDQLTDEEYEPDSHLAQRPPAPSQTEPNHSGDTCVVCGSSAIGTRYGVRSCKACADFFSKSHDQQFKCQENDACAIMFKTRNKCRSCRLRKCFKVGMMFRYKLEKESSEPDQTLPDSFAQTPPTEYLPETHMLYQDSPVYAIQAPPPCDDYDYSYEMEMNALTDEELDYENKLNSKSVVPSKQIADLCKVCGSPANGYNYGVLSCNRCRRFFQKNSSKKWYCCHSSDIKLTLGALNKCIKCRLDKCFEMGMRRPSMDPVDSCLVCGDVAKGYRYGAKSCKFCGDFFHNYHNQRLECDENQSCVITVKTRHHCRFCRLQKCFRVGMRFSDMGIKQKGAAAVSRTPLGSTLPAPPMQHLETTVPQAAFTDEGLEYGQTTNWESQGNFDSTLCEVCEAPATGFNYGVQTCVGCRAFFRRHSNRIGKLSCNHSSGLEITVKTRKKCIKCRLDKCIALGMRPPIEAKKPELLPGEIRQKQRKSCLLQNRLATTLQSITQLHMETCSFTKDKAEILLENQVVFFDIPTTDQAWNFFAPQIEIEIHQILDFFQRLNCFDVQPTVAMLQKPIFQIYLLRIVRVLFAQGMQLHDGRFVEIKNLNYLFGEELVAEMIQISEAIRSLNLLDDALALFIVLVYLESQSTPEKKLVSGIRISLASKVKSFEELMALIPRLDTINNKFQTIVVQWLRENHKALQLPELFSEAFNIPRTDPKV